MIRAVDPVIRFTDKINPDPDTGCWFWNASLDGKGYGQFLLRRGKLVRAHRYAYALFVGEPPVGLDLDHICRNRNCCNPDHLEPVTRAVNLQRGNGPKASRERQISKTHCPNGHLYAPGTFRHVTFPSRPQGYRRCLTCYDGGKNRVITGG